MNESLPLRIVQLVTDDQIADVFPLVSQLRPRITRETFVAEVRRQEVDGYAAAVGYVDARPVVFAGYRPAHTLARGPHLFVDDLVTDESLRGRGYGRAMLHWLAERALELGLPPRSPRQPRHRPRLLRAGGVRVFHVDSLLNQRRAPDSRLTLPYNSRRDLNQR